MSFDCYIKFDNIEGESTDGRHQGWIEVISFKTGLKQRIFSTPSSAGGMSTGRADFEDFLFAKQLDKATPKLSLACAAGTHIDNILMEIYRAGTDKVKFMEYKLTNCIISKVKSAGAPGEFPHEIISINYGILEWSYTKQSRSGGGAVGQIAAGWDLERNCRL